MLINSEVSIGPFSPGFFFTNGGGRNVAPDVGKVEGTQQNMSGGAPVHEGDGGGYRIVVMGWGWWWMQ